MKNPIFGHTQAKEPLFSLTVPEDIEDMHFSNTPEQEYAAYLRTLVNPDPISHTAGNDYDADMNDT